LTALEASMALTDNCDLYAAVNESGLNLIATHIRRQRPSLFNYATADIVNNPQIACVPVDHSPDVTAYSNPLFTVVDPLPLFGADAPPVKLNYCAQLAAATVDLYPGNLITLPAELNPPFAAQHFALQARVCAGLDCEENEIGQIPPPSPVQWTPPQTVIPNGGTLDCFCLDGYVIGHLSIINPYGQLLLMAEVDDADVAEVAPPALKQAINCYLRDTIELVLREKLNFPVTHTFFFDFDFLKLPKITVVPTPNPPVANNPAVEDDQLKMFINFTVGP
jgi:hypothetical protein